MDVIIGSIIVGLLFISCWCAWLFHRAKSMLEKWAIQNGYRIIRRRYRWPFWTPLMRGPTVYFVVIEDENGERHSAHVTCGGAFFGLVSDRVVVNWVN